MQNYVVEAKNSETMDRNKILLPTFMAQMIKSFDWPVYFIFWEYLRFNKKERTQIQLDLLLRFINLIYLKTIM